MNKGHKWVREGEKQCWSEKRDSVITSVEFQAQGETRMDTESKALDSPEQGHPWERQGSSFYTTKTSFRYKCLFMVREKIVFPVEVSWCYLWASLFANGLSFTFSGSFPSVLRDFSNVGLWLSAPKGVLGQCLKMRTIKTHSSQKEC